jgi:hypothetical protein
MADTHRVMVRLSPELYAQLAARGSSGQPLAAIIRQALIDYLAQQPEQPTRAATQQPEQLQQPVSRSSSQSSQPMTRVGSSSGASVRASMSTATRA